MSSFQRKTEVFVFGAVVLIAGLLALLKFNVGQIDGTIFDSIFNALILGLGVTICMVLLIAGPIILADAEDAANPKSKRPRPFWRN
jgi:hypothetical protein